MQIKTPGDGRLSPLRQPPPRPVGDEARSKPALDRSPATTASGPAERAAASATPATEAPAAPGDCFLPPVSRLPVEGLGGELRAQPAVASSVTEPSTPIGLTFKAIEHAKLFVKGADETHAANPSDIAQGAAEDCWFLSSLATIALHHPELLEKNIADHGDGTYTVTLYQPPGPDDVAAASSNSLWGEEKRTFQIKVSGGLPHRDGERVFADAVAENGTPELWVSLYEKALATYLGGYENIRPNNGTVGMALIAGATTTQTIASYLDFSQVAEWFKKGDGLTVVSMPADIAPEIEAYRDGTLMAEHVYYVSNVDAEAGTVEIRNPFGWNHAPISMPWEAFKNTLGWIDHGAISR